jgi:hypothetical protein
MGHMRNDFLRDAFVDSGSVDKFNRYRIPIAISFVVLYGGVRERSGMVRQAALSHGLSLREGAT